MVRLADGKPPELLVTGMVRAKMCELIGTADAETTADQYFTVGLFSILDALMDLPLPEILDAFGATYQGAYLSALQWCRNSQLTLH